MLELKEEIRSELAKIDGCLILKIIDYINDSQIDNDSVAFVGLINSGLIFANRISESIADVCGITYPVFGVNYKLPNESILPSYLDDKIIFLIDDLFGSGHSMKETMIELLRLRKPRDVVITLGSLIGTNPKYIENYRKFEQYTLKLKEPHFILTGKLRQIAFFNNIEKMILDCKNQDEINELREALTIKS
jgi:hypothetical protein